MTGTRCLRASAAAALVLGATACSNSAPLDFQTVRPWERGALAEDSMRLGGHPVDAYVDDHTYFSKEASVGGSGVGSGGCGCN